MPSPDVPDLERPPSDAVLSPMDAQMRGAAFLAPIALLSIGPHLALWGLPESPVPTDVGGLLLFFFAFAVGVVLHEGLHGLGHVWGEASWDEVTFGMHWKALTPYAQCTTPTRARSYRIAIGLPGLVLGVGPLAIGLWMGAWLATFYGFLMLVAAAGDFLLLWILVGVPAGAWVQDHPRKVGCLVVAGAHASRPAPISENDLPDEAGANGETISFPLLLFLAAFSAACAAVGFLIALA